jgi:hypothetical protein
MNEVLQLEICSTVHGPTSTCVTMSYFSMITIKIVS